MAMQCFLWSRHWIFKYYLRETQAFKGKAVFVLLLFESLHLLFL